MGIYYALIIWVGLISILFIEIQNKERRNRIIVLFSCTGIFLVQALRANTVGVDLVGYIPAYEIVGMINVFAGDRLFNYEIGYILYSQFFSKLMFSNQLYLAVVSLTILAPIAYTWVKNSKMPGLSVYIYLTLGFFTFSFSGLRQAIAIAIVFLSFKYIQEKRFLKFLICIILATTFHTSAVIFIIAYPLYFIRFKLKHYLFIVPFFILIYLLKAKIFLFIYKLYSGETGEIVSTNAFTMLIVMLSILVLSNLFGNKNQQDLRFNAYKNYLLIAICIQIFASESNIAMRSGYYFYIFVTLLIPEVISYQRDLKIKLLATIILVIALLYFFEVNTGNGYLNVYPYHFYWE